MDGYRAFVIGVTLLIIAIWMGLFGMYILPVLNVVVGQPAPFEITWFMVIGYILFVIPFTFPILVLVLLALAWAVMSRDR